MDAYSNFNFIDGYFINGANQDILLFNFPRTMDDESIKLIDKVDGMLVVTLYDLKLNVYNAITDSWDKFNPTKKFYNDYAIISNLSNLYRFSFSNGGNCETGFGTLIPQPYAGWHESYSTSNGSNDRAIFCGSTTWTLPISYTSISVPLNNSKIFGDLTTGRYAPCALSNTEYNRGLIIGCWNGAVTAPTTMEYITISRPENANIFGNMASKQSNGSTCSNGINSKGIIIGNNYNYVNNNLSVQDILHVDVSKLSNALDFGRLSCRLAYWTISTDNRINNRGIIAGGSYRLGGVGVATTNVIDYISITTPANAKLFGNLCSLCNQGVFVSNGVKNRAVATYEHTVPAILVSDMVNISVLSDAVYFGDMLVSNMYNEGSSNC